MKKKRTDHGVSTANTDTTSSPLSTLSMPPADVPNSSSNAPHSHVLLGVNRDDEAAVDFEKERFTKDVLRGCEPIYQAIKEKYTKRLKNQFVVMDESDDFVAFKMVKYGL
jgi:hypothetical protein